MNFRYYPSLNLRNKLLQLYGWPYSGVEFHFGIDNTNWIHEVAFNKDLQMHFGKKIDIEDFRNEQLTTYYQVFDFIELYFHRAKKDLDIRKRNELFKDIRTAFDNSNSVYEFNAEGNVVVRIEDDIAKNITETDKLLTSFEKARTLFRDCIDGLIMRSKDPKDIVGDMYIVFEDYCKKTSKENTFENALNIITKKCNLHPIQIKLINSLKAYRGEVWGSAHAGNSPKPKEEDAIWYIESIIALMKYLDTKLKK